MARILHTGDLHLGAKMVGLPEDKRRIRKEEHLHILEQLVKIAQANDVELFLIAGDLFDSDAVSPDTFDYVAEVFRKASDINFVISPGNHDPYTPNSVYTKCKWPENVHVFSSNNMEYVEFEGVNTRVYGAAFMNQSNNHSLLENFTCLPYDGANIILIHGDYKVPDSAYNTVTVEQIKKSGADYVALGHVHLRTSVETFADTDVSVAYCGTPEGHGFDESGIKGVYIGDVFSGQVDLKFVRTCSRQFVRVNVDVSEELTVDEIINNIINVGGYSADDILRVELIGDVSEDVNNCMDQLLADAQGKLLETCFWARIVNSTSVVRVIDSDESGYSEFSLMSLFRKKVAAKLEEAQGDEEEINKIKRACELGVKSIEGREIDI